MAKLILKNFSLHKPKVFKSPKFSADLVSYLIKNQRKITNFQELLALTVKFGVETGMGRVLTWSITRVGLRTASFPIDCVIGVSSICHLAGEKFEIELLKKMGYPAKGLNWASDKVSHSLLKSLALIKKRGKR